MTTWPATQPITAAPRDSDFSGDLTLAQARAALTADLVRPRATGRVPKRGDPTPPPWATHVAIKTEHHRVIVSFTRETVRDDLPIVVQYVLACDTYKTVTDNTWAIVLHVRAIRSIERHGVGSTEQALAGFRLPSSPDAKPYTKPRATGSWREVLDFAPRWPVTPADVTARHRVLLKELRAECPDGSHPHEPILNNARDEALAALA